jgi:hypothetical protein
MHTKHSLHTLVAAGIAALLVMQFAGCRTRPPRDAVLENKKSPALERIVISPDQREFVGAKSGRSFVPWGFNYDRDYQMRLLEEYWDTEWATVEEDFCEMKQLGANVVRIHLQFAKFMNGPDEPNESSLKQLTRLVDLAQQTGLYLDLTGLACYRKTDVPAWYDALDETGRWQAQARFWEAVAATCAKRPQVFCYNLMNEPVAPGGKLKHAEWLIGEFGGFSYVQRISLDQAGRDRTEIARQWVAHLVRAIRKHDSQTLITVGLLPNSLEGDRYYSGFAPAKIAPELDFVSVHLYPESGKLEDDLSRLKQFRAGKPLVIEELFPLKCKPAELGEFIRASQKSANGWIGFYWGQTPEELEAIGTLPAAMTRQWLLLFQNLNFGVALDDPRRRPESK